MTIVAGLSIAATNSCTNLDEELFDQVDSNTFYQTEEEIIAAIGVAYANLRGYTDNVFNINEVSSDETIVPTRGGDWDDGGVWRQLFGHTWTPTHGNINGAWSFCSSGVTNINRVLYQVEGSTAEVAGKEGLIAELKILRAFNYWLWMDMFGTPPLVTSFADADPTPANSTRAEIYAFIEQEVLDNIDALSEVSGGEYYGRVNKWTAYALLAKLYLNAEVYTGTPQWEKAIAACDQIIESDVYILEPDFFANFLVNNEGSGENIFVIPYDSRLAGGMNFQMRTLHYQSQFTYNLNVSPWNGFATLADFYAKFEDNDARKEMWLIGQQYSAEGEPLEDPGYGKVIFTPEITALESAGRMQGLRSVKYEVQQQDNSGDQSNDFAVFRLADILLMKAEALLRSGGSSATALQLMNQVRARSYEPDDPLASVSLTAVYDERGRELAWEGMRRRDMIRFGTWDNARKFKEQSAATTELFPIPQAQIDANPNLMQNDGY